MDRDVLGWMFVNAHATNEEPLYDEEPLYEDLFRRLFTCIHSATNSLRNMGQFEEWSVMEIWALRAFQRISNHAEGTTGLARTLQCGRPYASKLMKRLRAKGLLEDGMAWGNHRSMVLTAEGLERLASDASSLDAFARQVFDGLSHDDLRTLTALLARMRANVGRMRAGTWGKAPV